MDAHDQIDVGRRRALRTIAAGATAGVLATSAGPTGIAAAQSTDLSEWFANTDNAGEVTDRTGESAVTVQVGTDGNGAGFGFGPAVVRVDPGTTVTWEWTGQGGQHNAVAEDGSFESSLQQEGTFESAGVTRYACTPHKMMGMKGAVVVGTPVQGGGIDWLKTGLVGLAGSIVAAPFVASQVAAERRDDRERSTGHVSR